MSDRKEYIKRGALDRELQELIREYNRNCESDKSAGAFEALYRLRLSPAADVVEVDMVAEMLYQLYSDDCPCNFSGVDEWLPVVCDFQNECPYPKGEHACWKQFIKHYGERKDGADNGDNQERSVHGQ